MQRSSVVGKGLRLYREKGDGMEKLLYECGGKNGKAKKSGVGIAIFLVILGVVLIISSQVKQSSWGSGTTTTQYIDGVGAVTTIGLGKSYVLPDEMRFGIIFMGILCILLAIFYIWMASKVQKNRYLKIYENHVEGGALVGSTEKTFRLTFAEIEDVRLEKLNGISHVIIYTKLEKYPVMMPDDGTKAYNILKANI